MLCEEAEGATVRRQSHPFGLLEGHVQSDRDAGPGLSLVNRKPLLRAASGSVGHMLLVQALGSVFRFIAAVYKLRAQQILGISLAGASNSGS